MNIFNYLKSQLPILTVVNEYATLKQAGIYWKGLCPFHGEKTPSFTVSPHKDIFYCFGCHVGGDVISFISKIENCSQIEAAKFLIDRYNIRVPEEIDKEIKNTIDSIDEKNRYFELCNNFTNWCHKNLYDYPDAKAYVISRGINQDSIERFNIGYFPGGDNSIKSLIKNMTKLGYLAHDLIQANILIEGKNLYSPFEERIIFPIRDSVGRFCGFGGRIFKINDERPKYYNSHENNYFNKGSLLFGLDLAKKSIQTNGEAFLVEGYTDCIAMVQNGYRNTIATLGTACTIEHLKLLNRFCGKLYVLYDGDDAGQKAILRLTELCWDVNLELMVICLPKTEDPASYLEKKGDLQKLIVSSKDIYSFFIETSCKTFPTKTLNDKIATVKKLTDIIQNIDDNVKKNILLNEVANKLNIQADSLKIEINNNNKIAQKADKETLTDKTDLEKRLFATVMNDFTLFNEEFYYLIGYFASPMKEILYSLKEFKEKNNDVSFNNFFDKINNEQKQFLNRTLLEIEKNEVESFKYLITQFQKKNWKKIAYMTKLQLAEAQQRSDTAAIQGIINNFQKMKNKLINGDLND